jgi:hypothetical protein
MFHRLEALAGVFPIQSQDGIIGQNDRVSIEAFIVKIDECRQGEAIFCIARCMT